MLSGIASLPAAQLSGRVETHRPPKARAARVVVYAERLDDKLPVAGGRFRLEQLNKTFRPHVLVIPVGSTVDFPNEDPFFHNVFSVSHPNPFDLGLYRSGQSRRHVFNTPGVYHVFCNIHPQMAAVILVVPTSHIAEADAAGRYQMNLPAGRYRVTAWSEAAQPTWKETDVAGDTRAPTLVLDQTESVQLPHKNKYGEDYPRAAYDQPNQ